uniref:DUF2975 domain-containing protein n=1 Tax=uncultured Erythrobacter sp. TaxID=263913 RepID=UPI00261815AB|nr:DUF2975 domain-containing protein [uncultured Erythrobacter sp.]
MTSALKDPLLIAARALIYIILAALGIGAAGIVAAMAVAIFNPSAIISELVEKVPIEPGSAEVWMMVGVLILAGIIVGIIILFFVNMLRIVKSVGETDPFVPVNATRLTSMAWLMLVAQILSLPTAGLAVALTNRLGEDPGTVDASLDFGGIMLILTLFILARVFKHGAAMREDLEGTV